MNNKKTINKDKQIVFSGTRATGRLHLGNYLGAVKGYIALQEKPQYQCIYMAVDLHTITTPYDHERLRQATRDIIMDYLAAGVDPNKAVITAQSLVPEHTYLAFLFSSVISMARMQHLPTFKDKVKQHPDNVTMALLNYPVLMAADILVYRAGLVPVGVDQEPHLEVAREIARKMNQRFFDGQSFFPEPQRFATQAEYVPSLTGQGKMSKSVSGSFINLMDDLETISSKVAAMPTDSGCGQIKLIDQAEAGQAQNANIKKQYIDQSGNISVGVSSLMTFVELFQGQDKRLELEQAYQNQGIKYQLVKQDLAKAISKSLKPIQRKRRSLEKRLDYVEEVIQHGASQARDIASANMMIVKENMGLA